MGIKINVLYFVLNFHFPFFTLYLNTAAFKLSEEINEKYRYEIQYSAVNRTTCNEL